jgi:maltooligosyltrehalose trehalohydrolase
MIPRASGATWCLGAHPSEGGTRFRVFSDAARCSVRSYDEGGAVLDERPLRALGDGLFETFWPEQGHGLLYRFVLDERELPDPYARFLPQGVHGPAMVIEPGYAFRHPLPGRPLREQVLYELHVGTFTPSGTYLGARERLPELAALGVTTLELMPLAAFAGERGWGYDGVALYAPFAPYGTPDDLRGFVDAAHGLGLGVVLDVVYNHLGPAGNYLSAYSSRYFTDRHPTPWGDAPNFADTPFRRLALENALYWLEEFRFDGLRLDATHALFDPSPCHFLRELAEAVRRLRPDRLLFAEDERNAPELVTKDRLDALWADDFHHQVHVTLTGEREGYYAGYAPGAGGVARAIERGWLYEGEPWPLGGAPRGAPARELSAERFVYALQNHDQVGNRARGERLSALVSIDAYLAAALLMLCLPMTPLLFMGEEWAAASPFLYFTDHEPELGRSVTAGRRREFAHFDAFRDASAQASIPDPQARETFLASRLDWDEQRREPHARALALYGKALALRRVDSVLRRVSREGMTARAHGDVLTVLLQAQGEVRAVVVNFGTAHVRRASLGLPPGFERARTLLASGPLPEADLLAPRTAVVLAARHSQPALSAVRVEVT